jgi:hypothetical protein
MVQKSYFKLMLNIFSKLLNYFTSIYIPLWTFSSSKTNSQKISPFKKIITNLPKLSVNYMGGGG